MKKLKTALIFLLTFVIVAASFVFPPLLFRVQDYQLDSQVEQAEINEVSLSLVSDLSILQKLSLVHNFDSSVNLDTGRFMDKEQATDTAIKELDSFISVIGDSNANYSGLYIDFPLESSLIHCYPTLNTKAADETNLSAIVWYLAFQYDSDEENCTISLSLDDETGKILSLYLYFAPNDDTSVSEDGNTASNKTYDPENDYVSPEEYTDNIDFEYFYASFYSIADFITSYLNLNTYSIDAVFEEQNGCITVYDDVTYSEDNAYNIMIYLTHESIGVNI